MPAQPREPRAFVRTFRVILTALIFGLTSFTAVALYSNLGKDGLGSSSPEQAQLYPWILFGLGAALAVAWRFIHLVRPKPEMVAGVDAPEPVARRVAAYATQTLLRAALVEGWGLMGTALYLATAEPILLAAPLIAVVILFSLIPKEAKIRELLEDHDTGGAAGGGAPAIEP